MSASAVESKTVEMTDVEADRVFEEVKAEWSDDSLSAEAFLAGWVKWISLGTDAQLKAIISHMDTPEEMKWPVIDEMQKRLRNRTADTK